MSTRYFQLAWTLYVLALYACRETPTGDALRAGVAPSKQANANVAETVARCSSCHLPQGAPSPKKQGPPPPTLDQIKQMSPAVIVASLERGTARGFGSSLTRAQRIAVAEALTSHTYDPKARAGNYCPESGDPARELEGPTWRLWGVEPDNRRFQSASNAKLTADQVARLKVKWAFALAAGEQQGMPVTVHGDRAFFGETSGTVRSIDLRSGCTHWALAAGSWVRSALNLQTRTIGGQSRRVAYFTSMRPPTAWAVDATTGDVVWRTVLTEHKTSTGSASPQLYGTTLLASISGGFESHFAVQDPTYECCTARGEVLGIDALTGAIKWKYFVVPEPRPTGTTKAGTRMWGPSGGSVYQAAALDEKLARLYVPTSQNASPPATEHADSILALDVASGELRWSHRAYQGTDVSNSACSKTEKLPQGGASANCPFMPNVGFDVTAPLLTTLADDHRLLLVPDKTGFVTALDPDHEGAVRWSTRVAKGGNLGGAAHWGMAADKDKVYVPIHDRWITSEIKDGLIAFADGPEAGGLVALRLTDGHEIWKAPAPSGTCNARKHCSAAMSSPPTAIDGAVFATSLDGHVRAYSSDEGRVLWDFDTTQEFDTVQGEKARGGSIDGPGGVTISNGIVLVSSGYKSFDEMPGNVLLAFSVDGR